MSHSVATALATKVLPVPRKKIEKKKKEKGIEQNKNELEIEN